MVDDYELDDMECPRCKHSPTHTRPCSELACEDGYISMYDEDPSFFDEDDYERCEECWGTGHERWCPKCGLDIQKYLVRDNVKQKGTGI